MNSLEFIFVVVAAAGNSLLGLFTFYKNQKSLTNSFFFLFTLSLSTYIFLSYVALHQHSDLETLFFTRIAISVEILINLLFFLLATTFPQARMQFNKTILFFAIASSAALIPLSYTSFILKDVIYGTAQPIPGPGISLLLIHTFIFLGGGFISLIKRYRNSIGIGKTQVNVFLIGAIFMLIALVSTNLLFVIIAKTTFFVGFLPFYTLIFVSFVSYAIIKHRFLDVNLIVARAVVYFLILSAIGVFYSVSFFIIGANFLRIQYSPPQFVFYGAITLIVAFTFQPLRRFIQDTTDIFIYKGHYNSQQLLKSFSDIMATTLDLKLLTAKILTEVTSKMRVTSGAFVLFEKNQGAYINYVDYKGFSTPPLFQSYEIKQFLESKTIIVFDDLDEGPLKETMRSLHAAVALPLAVGEEKTGLLFLGGKASGDVFSSKDIGIFNILAPELSIAIQNAKEYEQIKMFNITLKEEVDRATKQLQTANENLKQLDKLKDEFVSLASHELRTPMTAIKSYLWMIMAGKAGEIPEKQKYYLDRAYKSTDRLINLVNDMLNVSRIESGKIKLTLQTIDINNVIKDIQFELNPRSQELGLSILYTPNPSLPTVNIDPDKIKEVFINLIGNAFKFTPKEGSITITVTSLSEQKQLQITVKDTGAGIVKEDLPKLFQKFAIVGSDILKKQNSQGTGLGLYICKSLIEMHGGRIWAESEGEGKGTTFYFTIPTV